MEKLQLLTLSKPVVLSLQREWTDKPEVFEQNCGHLLVEPYELADKHGFITVTVRGYIPYKSDSVTVWELKGFGGPQVMRLRETLVQAITMRPMRPTIGEPTNAGADR